MPPILSRLPIDFVGLLLLISDPTPTRSRCQKEQRGPSPPLFPSLRSLLLSELPFPNPSRENFKRCSLCVPCCACESSVCVIVNATFENFENFETGFLLFPAQLKLCFLLFRLQ